MQSQAAPEQELDAFYAYGYRGRAMFAVRAPFAMAADGRALVGRIVRIQGARYEVRAIARQTSGPIAPGEPIGVEVCAVAPDRAVA